MGIQIINGGFLTTIQDMGRYGYQETGMSVSGVMDTRAASLANILVGNDTNEAVIEITMMGPTMKFTEDEIIAVTGGDLGAKIDEKPVERYRAVLVKAGQEGIGFRLLEQGVCVEMLGQAPGQAGLADSDRAFDDDVAGRGQQLALRHVRLASSVSQAELIRRFFAVLRHAFEAVLNTDARCFHLFDGG